jgi:hypothetical protein
MRKILISFILSFQLLSFGQAFYFERESHVDTCQISGGWSFQEDNGLIKMPGNNLMWSYDLTYCSYPGQTFRYVKMDSTGAIIWHKNGSSHSHRQLKFGHLLGVNFSWYDNFNSSQDYSVCYYDRDMNLKWKKSYVPDQPYSTDYYIPKFYYMDTIGSKNYFRYYYYYQQFPKDSNMIYITGNLDSTGNISNLKNEPIIYNSDSVNISFKIFSHQTKYIGNYANRSYFLNYGKKTSTWDWWSAKKVYCYAYISAFDSATNKYQYYDIKTDSLWSINSVIKFSNDRVWVFGSKQFQPYVFCMNLNGQVHWAKKLNMPELADGSFGGYGFNQARLIDQNTILVGRGADNYGPETYSYFLVDSLFQFKKEILAPYIYMNSFTKVEGAYYYPYLACKKFGVIKTRGFDSIACWTVNTNSIDIRPSQKPQLNYLELLPMSGVNLSVTSLNTFTIPVIFDTLSKTNGCIPTCYFPPPPPTVRVPTVTIYPNPGNHLVNINVKTPYSLKLYNVEGKKLMDLQDVKFKQIDVSPYPNGLYFIMIENSEEKYKERFIKRE